MGDGPRGAAAPGVPNVDDMVTLTALYAEAWSRLDPGLAEDIIAVVPEPRGSDASDDSDDSCDSNDRDGRPGR
jgi:hypothetical protein